MVVCAEHYAGDGLLLRKIYEMEDDCVNFLACSDGTSKVQRLVTWKKPDDGFVKLDVDGSLLGNPGRSSSARPIDLLWYAAAAKRWSVITKNYPLPGAESQLKLFICVKMHVT
ncbi:hypothetical protein Peur_043103 [Populus x canadensis]